MDESHASFAPFLQAARAEHGSDLAVVERSRRVTFAELADRADAYATLVARHVVRPNQPVPVLKTSTVEGLAAMQGVMLAGAVAVPLDHRDPQRVRTVTGLLAEPWVLTDDHRVRAGAGVESGSYEQLVADQAARLLFTSGSGGVPTGYVESHGRLVAAAHEDQYEPTDTVALLSPLAFAASTRRLFGALRCATPLIVLDPLAQSPSQLAAEIAANGVTILPMTPALLRALVAPEPEPASFESVRKVILGGDRVTTHDVVAIWERLGAHITVEVQYAATEAGLVARSELRSGDPLPGTIELEPFVGTDVRVLDPDGSEAAAGVIGPVSVAKARSLPRPFTGVQDLAGPAHREGAVVMADLGAMVDDRLVLHGRNDERVKVRGHAVDLTEVHHAVAAFAGVTGNVVMLTEQPRPHITAHVSGADVQAEALRTWLTQELPVHSVPGRIVLWEQLPLTARGKVDRQALQERARAEASGEAGQPAESDLPNGATALVVSAIWQEVLERSSVVADDNFFDLGGDSLAAYEVASHIERELDIDMSPAQLLATPVLSDLADRIDAGSFARGTCLIPFAAGPADRIIVFIHGDGGGALFASKFVEWMDLPTKPAIYGLQLDSVELAEKTPTLAHLAARYVDEITAEVERQTVTLVGWSVGGKIAWEMSQELARRGIATGRLVLLDTHTDLEDDGTHADITPYPLHTFRRGIYRLARTSWVSVRQPQRIVAAIRRRGRARPERPTGTRVIRERIIELASDWHPSPVDIPVTVIGTEGSRRYHQRVWGSVTSAGCTISIVSSTVHVDLVGLRRWKTSAMLGRILRQDGW